MSGTMAMVISGLFFAIVHGSVKYLTHIPAYELIFFRSIISLSITFIALQKLKVSPFGKNHHMLVLRGLFGTGALLLFFYTLQMMPMASAVTIQYLHPILTVLISAYFLKEKPLKIQWLFFFVSFLGVLLIRGFDDRVTLIGLLIGVISALFSSCAYTLIRSLRHEDSALVVVFYFPLISLILVGPYTLTHWVTPKGVDWVIIFLIGSLTQVAQYFMTVAYRKDSAANISNINYLGIIYAVGLDLFFWKQAPTKLALIGMSIIAASAVLSARFRSKSAYSKLSESQN